LIFNNAWSALEAATFHPRRVFGEQHASFQRRPDFENHRRRDRGAPAVRPRLLESAYQRCLARELEIQQIPFSRELALPVEYKGIVVDAGYRIDLLVEEHVIVEVKAIEAFAPIHSAQLLTYLRLARKKIGLLINFNVPVLKDGIVRRVL
jgi:GxxExxY protein